MSAFKEWTLICDALGRGEQSLIIRKGGIHEGRAGFRFQHPEFFLFPTLFHEQVAQLRLPAETPLPATNPDEITIRQYARVEWTLTLTDLAQVEKLEPYHLWRRETIAERFHYMLPRQAIAPETEAIPSIHVAFLRVYNLAEPWRLPASPRYGGCRSWVDLPEPAPAFETMTPALSDAAHNQRAAEIRALLGHDPEPTSAPVDPTLPSPAG